MRRVFGTLCFSYDKDQGNSKKSDGTEVKAKWEAGVMLGIDHQSTSWRVGVFREDRRYTAGRWPGWRWDVLRTSTVYCCEAIHVQKCEDLMKPNPGQVIFQRHMDRLGSAHTGPRTIEAYREGVKPSEAPATPDQA